MALFAQPFDAHLEVRLGELRNELPATTELNKNPEINGNCLQLSLLNTPTAVLLPPHEDYQSHSGKTHFPHVIASGFATVPLLHECSGLGWIEGLPHSPEMARNIQEARSRARWQKWVSATEWPSLETAGFFSFVLGARGCYLGCQGSSIQERRKYIQVNACQRSVKNTSFSQTIATLALKKSTDSLGRPGLRSRPSGPPGPSTWWQK